LDNPSINCFTWIFSEKQGAASPTADFQPGTASVQILQIEKKLEIVENLRLGGVVDPSETPNDSILIN
jgi:hypothetical protein